MIVDGRSFKRIMKNASRCDHLSSHAGKMRKMRRGGPAGARASNTNGIRSAIHSKVSVVKTPLDISFLPVGFGLRLFA